jgi:uncharacterized protein (TIGR03437 family)
VQTVGITALATSGGGSLTQGPQFSIQAASSVRQASCSGLYVKVIQPGNGFSVNAFQPVTVQATVKDSCGNLYPLESNNPPAASFLNGKAVVDPPINLGATATPGVYSGTWTPKNVPANVAQTPVTIEVNTASLVAGGASRDSVTGNVIQQVKNSTLISRIVNSASYGPDRQVTPCGWVSIFGQNLADSAVLATTVPLGATLANASTSLGGTPLPLNYVADGQMNAQIPCELNSNTQLDLQVIHGDSLSPTEQVVVAETQPAIFTINQQGFGQGAVFWTTPAGDHVTADTGNPVPAGTVVEIYGTGFGSVNPQVKEGDVAPSPAATLTQTATVSIGGITAELTFAGLVPGAIGVYQVNAIVPPEAPKGDAVPVVVHVGTDSQTGVTMAVR